jgi:hypothetical protein
MPLLTLIALQGVNRVTFGGSTVWVWVDTRKHHPEVWLADPFWRGPARSETGTCERAQKALWRGHIPPLEVGSATGRESGDIWGVYGLGLASNPNRGVLARGPLSEVPRGGQKGHI